MAKKQQTFKEREEYVINEKFLYDSELMAEQEACRAREQGVPAVVVSAYDEEKKVLRYKLIPEVPYSEPVED